MSSFPSGDGAPPFGRIEFIMVHPSHPGNVGAAARAIKTMGFQKLCLVAPRHEDIVNQAEAQALASGATDVLPAPRSIPLWPRPWPAARWPLP